MNRAAAVEALPMAWDFSVNDEDFFVLYARTFRQRRAWWMDEARIWRDRADLEAARRCVDEARDRSRRYRECIADARRSAEEAAQGSRCPRCGLTAIEQPCSECMGDGS